MEEVSTGALVPAVKAEAKPSSGVTALDSAAPEAAGIGEKVDGGASELDKDLMCPICMQIIKDAFLTACGHSFCYMCIITHLRNKSDCPCCGHYLTNNQLFPNFALNKLLKKASACQISKTASPVEYFRQALQQGCEVSIKELDTLLSLLSEKKRKMEQEEAERNMQILLDFLHCLRKQKVEELNEIQTDLQYIKEDVNSVERHRIELYRTRDRYSVKLRMLGDDPTATKLRPSSIDKNSYGLTSSFRNALGGMATGNFPNKKVEGKAQLSSHKLQRKDALSGSDSQNINQTNLAVLRKKRVQAQIYSQFPSPAAV
ncbi:hypothetical protein L1049_024764 [Liquidambar formosana]|uniref:RING-type domain-containing protein n=1 Tax=Liquidambar formosana TaxID=63359 RepID=A0AAP0RWL4_LIQFO